LGSGRHRERGSLTVRTRVAGLLGLSLLVAPQRATIAVHMIGDSTMAEKPNPDTNPERGWGQLLPRFFDDQVVVRNHAVNGRSTKSFVDEGKWGAVAAELHAGDYVLIQFGHNDEKKEDSTRYTNPATTFRENLERFVRESRARGAIPVLFTPIARRKFSATGALQATHGAYPSAVRAVASALDVPLIDLEALTTALVQRAGPEGSKKLYVWTAPGEYAMYPNGRQDDTHLSVAGATAVARLAARAIRSAAPPLGVHVTHVE
jgi:DNA sulfur modification protein DndE